MSDIDLFTKKEEPPPIPKRCSKCKTWYPDPEVGFYRKKERAGPDGRRRYNSICKRCLNELQRNGIYANESKVAKEKRRRKLRLRQRAWVRLGQEYPERFKEILAELEKEDPWQGPDDLRDTANKRRRKPSAKFTYIRCKNKDGCMWRGRRSTNANKVFVPCPWCGGEVEEA